MRITGGLFLMTLAVSPAQASWLTAALRGALDSHPALEVGYWISQIVLAVIAVVAAGFAYVQIRTFKLFELLKFVQSKEMVDARRVVRKEIAQKSPSETWWDEADDNKKNRELEACASVASTGYDVLGLYLKSHLLDRFVPGSLTRFFVRHWAASIVDTYDILEPYISARQSKHGLHYHSGYIWLYKRAKPYSDRERAKVARRSELQKNAK